MERRILSHFHFDGFNIFKLHRLDPSLPHQIKQSTILSSKKNIEIIQQEEVQGEDAEDEIEIVEIEKTLAVPANNKTKWSTQEIGLMLKAQEM